MRDFSWSVFAVTGNIEAYLLFKECHGSDCEEQEPVDEEEEVGLH
jgi:hypothetical protein